ncbi:MAG: hypothetical protein AB7E72_06045 [Lysobacterales bacterium]
MDYLGLFALGGFVGALATYGLKFIKDFTVFTKALTIIVTSALSGSVILFLDRFAQATSALGAYSVGLLVALMWAYASSAVEQLHSQDRTIKLLGIAHIAACVLVSLVATALFLPPAFREVWGI